MARGSCAERFLESACAGDGVLRARVEVLLAGAEKNDRFLATPTLDPSPSADPFAALEAVGAVIGRLARSQYAPAKQSARQLLQSARDLYGDEHLAVADAHKRLSIIEGRLGNMDAAEASSRSELPSLRRILSADSPALGPTVTALGGFLMNRGDDNGAQEAIDGGVRSQQVTWPAPAAEHGRSCKRLV